MSPRLQLILDAACRFASCSGQAMVPSKHAGLSASANLTAATMEIRHGHRALFLFCAALSVYGLHLARNHCTSLDVGWIYGVHLTSDDVPRLPGLSVPQSPNTPILTKFIYLTPLARADEYFAQAVTHSGRLVKRDWSLIAPYKPEHLLPYIARRRPPPSPPPEIAQLLRGLFPATSPESTWATRPRADSPEPLSSAPIFPRSSASGCTDEHGTRRSSKKPSRCSRAFGSRGSLNIRSSTSTQRQWDWRSSRWRTSGVHSTLAASKNSVRYFGANRTQPCATGDGIHLAVFPGLQTDFLAPRSAALRRAAKMGGGSVQPESQTIQILPMA
ncbi:hypothetical protein DFH09DRAFT_1094524 [Mycena vulgaris]|nr:hypothetical protein DFH09DRAFT_1094524 [Mycena vulgaris]